MSEPVGGQPEQPRSALLTWMGLAVIAALALAYFLARPYLTVPFDESAAAHHPAVGRRLPELTLEPMLGDAEPLDLERLRGQVALVNFWGPWCPACLVELPQLIELAESLADREDFRLVAISYGSPLDQPFEQVRADTRRVVERRGYDIPVWHDPQAESLLQAYNRRLLGDSLGFPLTILLDREGTIRAVWLGVPPDGQIRQAVEAVLAE